MTRKAATQQRSGALTTAQAPPPELSDAAKAQLVAKMHDDPLFFATQILGIKPWARQIELLKSVRDNKRTAVAAGHGVGKTFILGVLILWFVITRKHARVLATSTSWEGTLTKVWAEVVKLYKASKMPLGGTMQSDRLIIDGAAWSAQAISPLQADTLQGVHAADVLVVFDEAQGVGSEFWIAAEAMMVAPGARWIVAANPTRTTGEFHACFHARRELWNCINISCLEFVEATERGETARVTGAVDRAWIDDCSRNWGPGSSLFRSRVEGQFPEEGEGALIPIGMLEAGVEFLDEASSHRHGVVDWLARRAGTLLTEVQGTHMGLDVARFGTDQNVATLVIHGIVRAVEAWGGLDLMVTAGKCIALMRKWNVLDENVHIDVNGMGGGVVDRLHEQRYGVDGVNVGERVSGIWRHVTGDTPILNQRAELFWTLRQLLARREIIVPREFVKTWSDLTALTYLFSSEGKLKLPSKDEMRRASGRSPDFADSLVLTLSRSQQPMIVFWQ